MNSNSIDSPTAPLYPLRVAAELTSTSVYVLRQYVDLGLIIPFKTPTNRRLYSKVDIERILCIRKNLDEYGLNITGIKTVLSMVPCRKIKPCKEEDRKDCDAYYKMGEPCWIVKNVGDLCKEVDCRDCNVYLGVADCKNIKELTRQVYE